MALERRTVTVPLDGRIDESVDERMLRNGVIEAKNTVYNKDGAAEKAPGNEYISTSIDGGGRLDAHSLLPSRDTLLAGGFIRDSFGNTLPNEYYQLLALSQLESKWYKAGQWCPIIQNKKELNYSGVQIYSVETTYEDNYAYIAIVVETSTAGVFECLLSVIDRTSDIFIINNEKLSTLSVAPRFVNTVGKVHLYGASGSPGGNTQNTIVLYVLDPATPSVIPTHINIQVDIVGSGYLPFYDAAFCEHPTFGRGSAIYTSGVSTAVGLHRRFVDADGVIRVSTLDAARTPIGHISVQNVRHDGVGDKIACVHGEGTTTRFQIDNEDLTSSVASTVAFSSALPEVVAICEDIIDGNDTGIACLRVFSQIQQAYVGPGTGSNYTKIETSRFSFASGALVESNDQDLDHWKIVTRPFRQNEMTHIWLSFDSDDNQPRAALFHWKKVELTDTSCEPSSVAIWGIDSFEGPRQPVASPAPPTYPFPPVGNVTEDVVDYLWGSYESKLIESVDGDTVSTSKTAYINHINWDGQNYQPGRTDGLIILPGGHMFLFDGEAHAYGFAHAPEITGATVSGGGSIGNGTYYYKAVYEWVDGIGQLHRSAPSEAFSVTTGAVGRTITVGIKHVSAGDYRRNFADGHTKVVLYRTILSGGVDEFYKTAEISNSIPAAGEMTIVDTASDASIEDEQQIYTAGGVLPNGTPPPTQIVHRHRSRFFAVDEENCCRLVYTKPIENGVAPEWSPTLVHIMPDEILAVETLQNDLIVFTQSSVYTVRGDGINIFGSSGFYTEELRLPTSCTVNRQYVKNTNIGLLWGDGVNINVMNMQAVTDLGRQIKDVLEGRIIRRIEDRSSERRIRILTNAGLVIYDYEHSKWSVVDYDSFDDMARNPYDDTLYYIGFDGSTSNLYKESAKGEYGATPTDFFFSVETPWIKLSNLTGYQRIYWAQVLGELIDSHTLNVDVYINYIDSVYETVSVASSSMVGRYGFTFMPSAGRCESIKFRIYDSNTTSNKLSAKLNAIEIVAGFIGQRSRTRNRV